MKKIVFFLFVILLSFLLLGCSKKEEVSINKNNYSDYVVINVKLKSLQRADGTRINGSSKLYDDARMPYVIEVSTKSGVKIKRIDLNITVKFNVTYAQYSSSLGGNKSYTKVVSEYQNMVLSDLVDSYSFAFQYSKMYSCSLNGYVIESISGVVLA